MITAYIFIGLFCIVTIYSIIQLFLINKLKKRISILEDVANDKLIKLTCRTGFYDGSYNIGSDPKNAKYEYRVYVTELEKYENNYSKLKYDGCTVLGYQADIYKSVRQYVQNDFLEIKETTDITWLEKEKNITEIRKDKLERILNENE
jgi:hypothetical protein